MVTKENGMRFYHGSIMAEYTLPAALVAVVCIGALIPIATGSKDLVGLVKNDLQAKQDSTKAIANSPVSVSGVPIKKTESLGDINSMPDMGSITSSGDTRKNLDVGGANGATLSLAQQMTFMAQSLLASGDITQEQANRMLDLANQGKRMAVAQSALEAAYLYNMTSLTFEGKTYTIQDFASQFGMDGGKLNPGSPGYANKVASLYMNFDSSVAAPNAKGFMDAYQALQASGALSNPQVHQQITALAGQIVAVDDALSWTVSDLSDNKAARDKSVLNSSLQNNYTFYVDTYNVEQASTSIKTGLSASSVTQQTADEICKAGASKQLPPECK